MVAGEGDAVLETPAPERSHSTGQRRGGRARSELRFGIELFALCGLAITQPLLDLFGRSPEQFAFRGVESRGIVAFALVVTFVPAAALWVGEAAIGLISPHWRRVAHAAVAAALLIALALQVLGTVTSGPLRVVLALAFAAAGVVAVIRFAPVRSWLSFMAVAPVLFLATFLVWSPTSRLFSSPDAVAIDGGVGRPAPVVMVVFDELPLESLVDTDGTIDRELFPNFARLAGRSHWYRNTTSVSSSTWYAVPAIATGQLVEDGPAPIAADHPESIFTLLGDTYDMEVTESVTRLCPSDLCGGGSIRTGGTNRILRDALSVLKARLSYDGPSGDPVAGFAEPESDAETVESGQGSDDGFADFNLNQPSRVSTFLAGIVDARPALHYLHILLPHVPYRYSPSGAQYFNSLPDLGRVGDQWTDVAWTAEQGRQRHLLQLGYVDALLGQVIDRLEAQGLFDDALLVVTADHGISFRAGGPIRGLESQPLDGPTLTDLAWVPLFVKEPGQTEPSVDDRNALTVDVVPTIADVLDVEIPWKVDGRSLLGPERTDPAKPFRPSQTNAFGVEALDPVRVDRAATLDDVFANGVDSFLPPGGGDQRWWRLGPNPELIGLDLDAARRRTTLTEAEIDLVDPENYTVAKGAGVLPSEVRGSIQGVRAGDPLAVVVNGVVAATAPAYPDGGDVKFSAMVAPDRFRAGTNQVTVYRMS